jgi:hypothetical protein
MSAQARKEPINEAGQDPLADMTLLLLKSTAGVSNSPGRLVRASGVRSIASVTSIIGYSSFSYKCVELCAGNRPAKQITLVSMASMISQEISLRFGFNSFGDDG